MSGVSEPFTHPEATEQGPSSACEPRRQSSVQTPVRGVSTGSTLRQAQGSCGEQEGFPSRGESAFPRRGPRHPQSSLQTWHDHGFHAQGEVRTRPAARRQWEAAFGVPWAAPEGEGKVQATALGVPIAKLRAPRGQATPGNLPAPGVAELRNPSLRTASTRWLS